MFAFWNLLSLSKVYIFFKKIKYIIVDDAIFTWLVVVAGLVIWICYVEKNTIKKGHFQKMPFSL
ncbi:hypothetical protein M472_21895 [Sphingobacterium paucimobilis HER1398]|uniref:Uncharacterized protein n=1 Tax=Sphingobacterium paucimobilis HER1398 TaxID=1346330 RepID=U2JFF6_9SPHI|nr:hypothetical protein M472_21895 [Sphingobacterium paucimobilis HER1398]